MSIRINTAGSENSFLAQSYSQTVHKVNTIQSKHTTTQSQVQ